MKVRAEYKNAIRSRRLIKEAFVSLLLEKEFDRITVTDIVRVADINRGTFYAHYVGTKEVLDQIENEIIDKLIGFINQFSENNIISNTKRILLKLAEYLESEYEFLKKFFSTSNSDNLFVRIKEVFIKSFASISEIPLRIRQTKEFQIQIAFFAGGIISVYRDWFNGTLECSLGELATEISKLARAQQLLLQKYHQ